MAIPAMAMLQQHEAWQDNLIEPAARRRAAIEARGAFQTAGIRNWGHNWAVKTNRLVCKISHKVVVTAATNSTEYSSLSYAAL